MKTSTIISLLERLNTTDSVPIYKVTEAHYLSKLRHSNPDAVSIVTDDRWLSSDPYFHATLQGPGRTLLSQLKAKQLA